MHRRRLPHLPRENDLNTAPMRHFRHKCKTFVFFVHFCYSYLTRLWTDDIREA